jgi:hypothetical protein
MGYGLLDGCWNGYCGRTAVISGICGFDSSFHDSLPGGRCSPFPAMILILSIPLLATGGVGGMWASGFGLPGVGVVEREVDSCCEECFDERREEDDSLSSTGRMISYLGYHELPGPERRSPAWPLGLVWTAIPREEPRPQPVLLCAHSPSEHRLL